MEVSMRHLKDINMKKATLLLVMTCCTIGLGRVGASDGDGVSPTLVEATTDATPEKSPEQQTGSTRDFRKKFQQFKASIQDFKYVSAKIGEPLSIGLPLTDYIAKVKIKPESLTDLTATLNILQEKVIKDLIRALALGLVRKDLQPVTRENTNINKDSAIIMLIRGTESHEPGYTLLKSETLEEHIDDYSKAFREIGLDIETLVVRKVRFRGLNPSTEKDKIELIAEKMCQILLSCLALKSATLNGLATSTGVDLSILNKNFSGKIDAFKKAMKKLQDPMQISSGISSVLTTFEDLIQTTFECASKDNTFLDEGTITQIQEALGLTKKSWLQLPTFPSFVQQSGTLAVRNTDFLRNLPY